MKKLLGLMMSLIIAVAAIAGGNETEKETKYKVVAAKSNIAWKGKKVTGEHFGKILFKQGSFTAHAEDLLAGEFVVDMSTITCEDLDETYGAKLVGHLKSPDFFNVKEFPTSSLVITNIQAESDENYTIEATLTIKGISQPVVFPAQITMNGKTLAARGELIFDRSLFDVRYGSGKFFEGLGDKMIYDDVALSFVIVAEASK